MTTLIAHLEELNANTEAWVAEDPSNRWAGLYMTDLDCWAEMGVHTVEDFKRYELETYVYETTKDVFGYRPSGLKEMTMEQLQKEAESLSKSAEEHFQEEARIEQVMLDRFKERVAETRDLITGSSLEDAIRIIADAEGIDQDELRFYGYESLEYNLHLKFGTIKKMLAEA